MRSINSTLRLWLLRRELRHFQHQIERLERNYPLAMAHYERRSRELRVAILALDEPALGRSRLSYNLSRGGRRGPTA